jgi:hypothetical protein
MNKVRQEVLGAPLKKNPGKSAKVKYSTVNEDTSKMSVSPNL